MSHPSNDHGEGGIGSPSTSAGHAVSAANEPSSDKSERSLAGIDHTKRRDGKLVSVVSGMVRVPSITESVRSVAESVRSVGARLHPTSPHSTERGDSVLSHVVGNVSIRKEILRGTKVSKALGRLGALWRTAPDELPLSKRQKLWYKSEQCDSVDVFISHAWSSPWWQRYLTLLIHFYGRRAIITMVAVGIVAFLLDLADLLPTVHAAPQLFWDMKVDIACWYPVPTLAGLFVLFLSPAIAHWRQGEPKVFLDVVCINQAEEELKVEGVQSIGGFLNKSRSMLVLWAPQNLERAWCVFEVATFIALHGDQHVIWCPIFLYSISFIVLLSSVLYMSSTMAESILGLRWMLPLWALPGVFLIQFAIPFAIFHKGRAFMRERHQLAETLARFKITDAQCRQEEDQTYILDSVRHWYGDESNFNKYVRGPLTQRMLSSTAAANATYLVLACTPSATWFALATARAYFRSRLPMDQKIAVALNMVNMGFFFAPITLKLLWLLTDLSRDKFANRVVDISCSVLVSFAWFVLINAFLWGSAQSSLPWAVGYLVGSALTCWLLFVDVPACMARQKARVRPAELEGDHDKAHEESGAGTAGCLPEEPKHRDPPRK